MWDTQSPTKIRLNYDKVYRGHFVLGLYLRLAWLSVERKRSS